MDYENVKAIILARLKQWKEVQEKVEIPREASTAYLSLAEIQIADYFCKDILQDLETAYNILGAQEKG